MFGESGFTHGDFLRGHNQYAGRSLKMNGPVYQHAYRSKEKTRGYASLTEAAKKEEGVNSENKGGKTKVTISGTSGFHLGTTITHTFTPGHLEKLEIFNESPTCL
ncbi:hypothetical protein AAH678_27480 [Sodalis endosymbiont of Spalangia cameroni]|uniref:hypothetical protein n=1 Tax=Sodalis praecaptivus TaxID=1239307 RepID=UPI0031FA25B6